MQPDFERSAAALLGFTEKAITAAVAPLLKRIEALESRPMPEQGEPGERGEQGVGVAGVDKRAGVLVLRLTDGSEHEVGQVDGADGAPGQDGTSPDPEVIAESFRPVAEQIVSEAVAAGLASLPPPEKGEKGDQGLPGTAGADGRGWAKSFIDRDGNLIATFSDGSSDNLGPIIGKDGAPGRDGFELEDYDEWFEDDGRTLVRRYVRGEDYKEFRHQTALPVDRGVFKSGQTYQRGDTVTWGGSLWIAQVETGMKPDATDSGWRLAVRKGRDGKDAK